MLNSVFSTGQAVGVGLTELILCMAVSLLLGLGTALVFMFRNRYTKNFVVTLAILPVIIQLVITLVNGNLGAGVAVAGAFSLVRFRSMPGNAREISAVFLSMAIGLATGMGYLTAAVLLFLVVGLVSMVLAATNFGVQVQPPVERLLKVTIPEDLDYTDIFDDLFHTYTSRALLRQVKTTNMGSLFELQYEITLRDIKTERELLNQIRVRNGNLTIVCGRIPVREEL